MPNNKKQETFMSSITKQETSVTNNKKQEGFMFMNKKQESFMSNNKKQDNSALNTNGDRDEEVCYCYIMIIFLHERKMCLVS